MKNFGQRLLVIYSGILTLVFAVSILGGFASDKDKTDFKEINVERINLVEPDGTLRMVFPIRRFSPAFFSKAKNIPTPIARPPECSSLTRRARKMAGSFSAAKKIRTGREAVAVI